jgi:hypothetical protein
MADILEQKNVQFKEKISKTAAADVDRQNSGMKFCKRRGISNLREED